MTSNEFEKFCMDYENNLISYLNKYISYDGELNSYLRDSYRNGKVYKQSIYRVKYTVNKGKFFDETISFRFVVDEEMDIINIYENYSANSKAYSKYKPCDLGKYILLTIKAQTNIICKQKTNAK